MTEVFVLVPREKQREILDSGESQKVFILVRQREVGRSWGRRGGVKKGGRWDGTRERQQHDNYNQKLLHALVGALKPLTE